MKKFVTILLLLIIISFVVYVPFSDAFLDWLFDAIDKISNTLNQLELLQAIHDFQSIQADYTEFKQEFESLQRTIYSTYEMANRWYYFTINIKNQNLLALVNNYIPSNVPDEYNFILNMQYGEYGNVRANDNYKKTAEYLQNIVGKPKTDEYSAKDPNTAIALNYMISATDNLNQSGNMNAYEQYYAVKLEEWLKNCSKVANNEHTSTESLLKCLVNYNILQIDYNKGQYAYYQSQMKFNFANSLEKARKYNAEVNLRADSKSSTQDVGSIILDEYINYTKP